VAPSLAGALPKRLQRVLVCFVRMRMMELHPPGGAGPPLGLGSSFWGRDEGDQRLQRRPMSSDAPGGNLAARATRSSAAAAPQVPPQRRQVSGLREVLRQAHGSARWAPPSVPPPAVSLVAVAAAPSTAASQGSAGAAAESGVGRGEEHKLFDRAVITAKAGDGGNGSVLRVPRPALPGPRARPGRGPRPGRAKPRGCCSAKRRRSSAA